MSVPEAVRVRLHLYTLACHELLNCHSDLQQATLDHPDINTLRCIREFNAAMEVCLNKYKPDDTAAAAQDFGVQLDARAHTFRSQNPPAAEVFDQIIAAVKFRADGWDYERDVANYHAQGRDMAHRYFASSPWSITQQRLQTQCVTIYKYLSDKTAEVAMSYQPLEQEIVIRLSLAHSFFDYLAYPLQFLHEYTAHVYSTDNNRNAYFNDAWMLYAAAAYFKMNPGVYPDQARLFFEHTRQTIHPTYANFVYFVEELDSWLDKRQGDSFQRLTYEMAAFQPASDPTRDWLNQFIIALFWEFREGDRPALQSIVSSSNLRQIGCYLWQRPKVKAYFEKCRPGMKLL